MTKDTGDLTQFHAVACRECTLPRKDGCVTTKTMDPEKPQKLDPCWKFTNSCLHGKHGVEIRIWSLSGDNTHSWVLISHGSNNFVIDSNNNDTEVPEYQFEEQALHLNAEGFCEPTKGKSKTRKKRTC